MIKRALETRNVRFYVCHVEVSDHVVSEKPELFRRREDEATECGDVGSDGGGGDGEEVFVDGDADEATSVFFLEDAVVGAVGAGRVSVDVVEEVVLRAASVGGAVGEDDGGAADAEEAVDEDLGAVVAHVAVWCDVLCADH